MTTPRKPTPAELAVDLEQLTVDIERTYTRQMHLSCHDVEDVKAARTRARYSEKRLQRIAEWLKVQEEEFRKRGFEDTADMFARYHTIAEGTES